MFDRDRWLEIWNTLSRNKLRTFLTAFGVGWGIFMLVVMLGAGNGLSNGVQQAFAGWATNSAYIWSQRTSMPYAGFDRGRRFEFDNEDTKAIRKEIEGLDALAPRNQLGGWRGSNNVVRNNKTGAFTVNGDIPEILKIQQKIIEDGRFINEKDVLDARKVCVIGPRVVELLFDKDEEPVGGHIRISGVYFQVVGIHRSMRAGENSEEDDATIFIPFSTFQKAFNYNNFVGWYAVTALPGVKASQVEEDIIALLKRRHDVHPEDELAIGSFNAEEEFTEMNMIFTGISGLSWFVGVLTLIAGVIGISNIMLVIIKERTKEIGIRRAIGAGPRMIRSQIMMESLVLTVLAGYAGLVIGVGLLELVQAAGASGDFFKDPEVDLATALIALTVLIISGLLAGLIPASRAMRINTADALRAE